MAAAPAGAAGCPLGSVGSAAAEVGHGAGGGGNTHDTLTAISPQPLLAAASGARLPAPGVLALAAGGSAPGCALQTLLQEWSFNK